MMMRESITISTTTTITISTTTTTNTTTSTISLLYNYSFNSSFLDNLIILLVIPITTIMKIFTLLLIVLISTTTNVNAEYDESNYMSDLLQALTNTPSSWSNKIHYCKWKGVTCNSIPAVTSIILPSNSLTGTLPPNIDSLTNRSSQQLAQWSFTRF
jgi:hypothetical protein